MTSITSEMAERQQIVHRGSERISGICGRLMCCIAYENEGYENLAQKMPALGSDIKINGKKGRVVGQHILKQTVDVQFRASNGEDDIILEIDVNIFFS